MITAANTPEPMAERVGRYRVLQPIAAGGMATVHLAILSGAGGFSRLVAVKKMLPQFAFDREFVAMFMDEAQMGSRIRHPHVVPVLDVVREGADLLLVMEYIHGAPLNHLLSALRRQDRTMPPAVAATIALHMLMGLHAVHEATGADGSPLHVVHRDVSPQNMLIGVDGQVRVTDFGIAKSTSRLRTTTDGKVRGKFAYMAPEQLRGDFVDRRADIFAAGVVIWELFAGRRLFDGPSEVIVHHRIAGSAIAPLREVADVPDVLDGIVMRALSFDPEQRPKTCIELADALTAVIAPASPAALSELLKSCVPEELEERRLIVAQAEQTLRASEPPPAAGTSVAFDRTEVLAPALLSALRSASLAVPAVSLGKGPVSERTDSTLERMKGRRRTWAALIGGGLVLLTGALVFGFAAKQESSSSSKGPPPMAASPGPKSQAGAEIGSAAHSPPQAASSGPLTAPPTPPQQPTTATTSKKPVRRVAAPKARPKQCSPPYVIDKNGHKQFKLECL